MVSLVHSFVLPLPSQQGGNSGIVNIEPVFFPQEQQSHKLSHVFVKHVQTELFW